VSVVVAAAAATELDAVTREWVSAATSYAHFAGPDGAGTKVGERWGVGHALLRVGHARTAQPLTLGDGVWLSADARLDDQTALRAALRAARQRAPEGADDAELVLRAYAAWGERFLDRLAGDFAFVLWDEDRQELLCGCDQLGVVPLHYATLDGRVLVASSPELLLLHPEVPDALDEGALADFLLTGQPSTFGTSAFAAIRRVPAAHVLRWFDGQLSLRRYWHAPVYEPLLRLRRPADYVEHFRHLLELAVGDRIGSGALATQLSGGMDSTTVTALAHRLRTSTGADGQVRAVTGVLGGSTGDQEGDYARLVAEALGIELDVIDESKLSANDPFAEPSVLTPEPTPYQWSDLQYQSIRVAAQHARICLTGLAADPLLRVVPWYWLEWLRAGHGVRLAVSFADQARLFRERPHPHLRTSARYLLGARSAPAPSIPGWLAGDFARRTDASDRLKFRASPPAWTWDKRALSRDPVWQTWFTWADPSYSRLALRMHHPFTDLRLLDFAARVPPYPWLVEKRILRDATEDLLPATVRRRPKTPLVNAPRSSATPEARRALVQLLQTVPEAERFFDTQALIDAVLATGTGESQDWVLARPLGLVHWLAHWKRPGA
jgi:asparagine synthase (glutamine-hydrolysing)